MNRPTPRPQGVQLRRQTVAQALAATNDIHLFVMNIKRPKGNINMTVKGDDGMQQGVVIPDTFIPVDMSLFINRENLLNNQHFRRLIARGDAVVLVTTEDAQKAIATTPSAEKELKRLLSENSTYVAEEETSDFITMKASDSTPNPQGLEETIPNLNRFAMGIVQQAAEGVDTGDLLLDIERSLDDLTLNDLEYICAKVEDPALKQWIVDKIAEGH